MGIDGRPQNDALVSGIKRLEFAALEPATKIAEKKDSKSAGCELIKGKKNAHQIFTLEMSLFGKICHIR